jgi:hypothetical protein
LWAVFVRTTDAMKILSVTVWGRGEGELGERRLRESARLSACARCVCECVCERECVRACGACVRERAREREREWMRVCARERVAEGE